MVSEERFTTSRWTKYKLVPVRNDTTLHRQVGNIQMDRFSCKPVSHLDTERRGRIVVVGFFREEAQCRLNKSVKTFLTGKSPALPGIPAQYKVATSVVLCRGLHSINANALPQSFFSCFSSAGSSDHAIMLKCARIEESPKLWASFRYFSIHSLLIWLARL